MIVFITSLVAAILFVAYVVLECHFFGIPISISNSFYLYNSKKNGLGYVFTMFLFAEAFLMMFTMLSMSEGHWWQFLGFIPAVGIGLCGCAPDTNHNETENRIHTTGALTGAFGGLLWCSMYNIALTMIMGLFMCWVSVWGARYTDSYDEKHFLFWAEVAGFGTTLVCLLFAAREYAIA